MGSLANDTLPIINFSEKSLEPGSPSWLSTSKDVVRALEDYGCLIATYAKFSPSMHEALFQASQDLIDLPTDVKIRNISDIPSDGYIGKNPNVPLYESLGIQNATTDEGVQSFTSLLWPSGNNPFSEIALEYSKVLAEIDQVVMRMVSESYGIEKSYESLHGATSYLLKFIKYRVPAKDETNLGITPHSDKSFTTILQQHQVKGLEIETKNGGWVAVDPSPSSFVVMAGDGCMAWTNGRIEPANHRVIIDGSKERYSVGLFSCIKDLKIQVPEELVDDDHPLQFKPFVHDEYLHFYYTEEGQKSKCPIRDYCGV